MSLLLSRFTVSMLTCGAVRYLRPVAGGSSPTYIIFNAKCHFVYSTQFPGQILKKSLI